MSSQVCQYGTSRSENEQFWIRVSMFAGKINSRWKVCGPPNYNTCNKNTCRMSLLQHHLHRE